MNFPKADLVLIWKFFDLISHKTAEKIIDSIKSPAVVSFSTKSLKNKRMSYPRRGWFEQMLKRKNKNYIKITKSNEVFYVVE